MSLNKFTDALKGLDLDLKIGADKLTCNSLEVLTSYSGVGPFPVFDNQTNTIAAPSFSSGSQTFSNKSSIYTKTEMPNGDIFARLSATFHYSNVSFAWNGSQTIVEYDIIVPDEPTYPSSGWYLPGTINLHINDKSGGGQSAFVFSSFVEYLSGEKIHCTSLISSNISNVVSDRTMTIACDFTYKI